MLRAPSPLPVREPILFVGETLVDLICHRPVATWAEADSFTPHCGGAATNAAIVAARCGAAVALAGGVGDDQWGRWLEERLLEEQVDLRWWSRMPGRETAVAFVVVDTEASPDFLIYGRGIGAAIETLEPHLEQTLASCAALVLGSNTFVGETERRISFRARDLALAGGKPVLVDLNLRLHRWTNAESALEVVRALCDGAVLVKVNREEARLLTGDEEPEAGAEAICALGSRLAVVTLGAGGAIVRGAASRDVEGISASVVDTTGAGDAVTGVLAAALARGGFRPESAARALPLAVEVAARSAEGFGAIDSLPERIPLSLPLDGT